MQNVWHFALLFTLVADWINTLAILALRVYVIWDKSKRIGILLLVLLLVCFLYRTLGLTN